MHVKCGKVFAGLFTSSATGNDCGAGYNFTETKIRIFHIFFFPLILEAEKAAQVSKIQFDQKIMEKESLRKMSEIEGELYSWFDVITSDNSNRDARVNKLKEI